MTDQLSSDLASLRIDRDAPQRGSLSGPSRASPLRRFGVPIVVVLAIGVVGWLGWEKLHGQVFKQEVKTTEIAMLSPSQAEVQVTATGYVIPQRTSKVGSKIPGRISQIFINEGDTVKEGQVICNLDDADQRSAMAAAGSRVGVAQARVSTARANLAEVTQQVERERNLVASGAVGKSNLDNLEAREKALKEAVRAAEAEVGASQADVGTFGVGMKERVITTPIGGRVVGKPATIGEYVGGFGNPTPIAEVVDFSSMLVETDVPEARLHFVKIGGPTEIVLDAYPNKRYRGVAIQLGDKVNRSKATIVVKVKFIDDIAGVLPEMSARVSFLSKAIADEAVNEKAKKVVSADAVVDRDGRKVIFTIDSGKLRAFPVKVGGAVGAGGLELLDGPPPGTKLVAKPTSLTFDGQRIKETDK